MADSPGSEDLGTRSPLTTRQATPADAPLLEAINLAADSVPDAVAATPALPGDQLRYLVSLIERGRVIVAEDGDSAVGFAATVDTGRARHLADLFVRPESQGMGIGRRLLDEVFEDVWPRTTFASEDPKALPLYVRAGMDAHWPNLYLAGDPGRLPPIPADLIVEIVPVEVVAALEADWAGVDRGPELAYWASLPDFRPVVVRRGDQAVGTGLSRRRRSAPGRWIHQAIAAPDVEATPVLLAMMADGLASGPVGGAVGGACVPGPAGLVRPLLEAGFRILDRDTFMASDPSIVDPSRELMDTGAA
jgi:GNAT superfamily N-acetyltransferase